MEIINIGILAHVDAGKTSLTERILYETGVISSIGSVDKGTTRTDTMEIERARGITIRSAVVSFNLGGLKVNLIDTPGHGDFVAEVERSLGVLDAVILVVSAVEGVQSQTRRLARAIREAGLPMVIFVNKIDRIGARPERVLEDVRVKLGIRVVAMNRSSNPGTRDATAIRQDRNEPGWQAALTDTLAESNEQVIEAFDNSNGELPLAYLEQELRRQVACGLIVPAFAGSAIGGAGAEHLLDGIAEWLPPAVADEDAPLSAIVFKIARNPSGEKIVYVRLFTGSLAVRQIITISRRNSFGEAQQIEERITGIDGFGAGSTPRSDRIVAGDIACLHGPKEARIGDQIGEPPGRGRTRAFPAPKLESVVRPVDPGQVTLLRSALEDLAEQDPLISLRQRNEAGEISVRLFGEVQKEVMTETLLGEYGIEVSFGETQVVCIERPLGTGEHVEI
jgi:ribosomal protection tetracycline resistance protein